MIVHAHALVRTIAALLVAGGLARIFRERAPWSAAEIVTVALCALFTWTLDPIAGVLWAIVVAASARRTGPRTHPGVLPLALVALVVFALALPQPLMWDEHVWLTKADLAAMGGLTTRALTPGSEVIPAGYPILAPLAAAWLGGPTDVEGGAIATRWLCAALLIGSLLRHRREWLWPVLILCAATPLVLVHARLAYADLPVGLVAASLALELCADTPDLLACLVRATLLAGLKDEGVAHAVGISAIALFAARRDRSGRALAPLVAFAGAAIPFVVWRLRLYAHGISDADHALGLPDLAAIPALAPKLLAHATDLQSFGAIVPLTAAVFVAIGLDRPRGIRAQLWPLARIFLVQAAMLALGVLCGPPRVREFALGGSLLGRLLLQLVPTAALLAAGWLAPAAAPTAPADPSLRTT